MREAARRRLLMALVTVLLASIPLCRAHDALAQRQLRVERFDVELAVHDRGTMDVQESIRYAFRGSWNGVFRDIPINYRNPAGLNYRLVLRNISVTNSAGQVLRSEVSRTRGRARIKVWVPGARDTAQTVVFHYQVENPLRFFDGGGEGFSAGYDELYWNVTGNESEIPVDQSSATISLPLALTGVQVRAYTGSYGSTASDADITPTLDGFRVESLRGFGPREGLTVDLAWDAGVIPRPTLGGRIASALRANWALLLPVASLVFMWGLWRSKGKDPARLAVAPQYRPPEGMTPAEVGTLVDNRPHMRDITASIVDLAVRGYIRIERRPSNEYTFVRLEHDQGPGQELTRFEKKLMRELFDRGDGHSVKTEDLESDFYSALPDLKDRIFRQLIDAGYYGTRPDRMVAPYVAGGLVLLGLGLAFAWFLASPLGLPWTSLAIGFAGSAVPVLAIAPFMSRRTRAGARQLEHVLGFQDFLVHVEADRFKRMIDSPDMFERYLPYAMALGVDKRWARAFRGIYTEPPSWYIGDGAPGFNSVSLSRSMASMSSRAGSVMTSRPRSSGGSGFGGGGFGGGGFSGGGFGGGGTGGF